MSFISVYKSYFRYVYNYLRRRLQSAADAEEVTLIVFEAVWKGLPKIENPEDVQPWIFGIARHKLYDFFRKRYRLDDKEVPFSALNEFTPVASESVSMEEVDSRSASEQSIPFLWELIKDLKDVDQQIVELKYKAGWTYTDIAEELEMTVNNVKVRHNRLIKKLYETWLDKI